VTKIGRMSFLLLDLLICGFGDLLMQGELRVIYRIFLMAKVVSYLKALGLGLDIVFLPILLLIMKGYILWSKVKHSNNFCSSVFVALSIMVENDVLKWRSLNRCFKLLPSGE